MTASTEGVDTGARILIVEDSPTQAAQLRHLLEEDGYRVTAAANGALALLAARREKPALILSDIVMPEMDGYAFCRAVKSDDQLKDVPVILMTSLSTAGDVVKGLQCGADNFIRKPYENQYLLARINYVLTNRTLRHTEKLQIGVHILLGGENHFITADRQQILDLLISTYEEAVHLNADLKAKEEQLARSNRTLVGLYRIAEALNRATSQQEVFERVLDEAMELPGVQAGWFFLREGETGFRVAAARGLPPALNTPAAMESDCLCRRRLLSGELAQATNILECERLQTAQGDTRGLRCHASVPLWAGGRTVGVMNLVGSQQGMFRDEELRVLNGVGNQIALALERVAAKARADQYAQQLADRVEIAETKYQTLMQHANDAIFIVDPAGPVLEVNGQAEAMLGRPSTEIVGRRLMDLVTQESHGEAAAHFQQLLIKGAAHAPDIHLRRSDGRQVCADFSASLVPVRGEPFVLAIARDVTERNRLERQFQQAQKMEAIGQLAGGVAHDFNNLLTVILGYSEFLMETFPADDSRRQDVGEIRKAGQSAGSLTRQLLAFSRKQILEPVVLDLNAVLANSDRMVRRLIGEHIKIITRFDPELGLVKADAGQIEQILVNLAVNARDAMPEGGTLTIETGNVEFDEPYVRTHVGAAVGSAYRPGSQRHRARDGRADPISSLRTVLHDQGERQGHGVGTRDHLRDCQTKRRVDLGLQRARARHHVQGLFPTRRRGRRTSRVRQVVGSITDRHGNDLARRGRERPARTGQENPGAIRLHRPRGAEWHRGAPDLRATSRPDPSVIDRCGDAGHEWARPGRSCGLRCTRG